MLTAHLGEFAALLTAVCWTVSSISCEVVSKQVGSTAVNLLKLCLAFVMLSVYALIVRGRPLPTDATLHNWVWLALSGVAGFVLGDLFLFRAFTIIGARVSMLIMATAPLLTAVIGWVFLGEQLSGLTLLGMGLTVVGIAVVVLERNPGEGQFKFTYAPLGLLLAFGGAAGQAIGLTLSKYGMGGYDAVAATQIRQVGGAAGLFVVALAFRNLGRVRPALLEWRNLRPLLVGSALGSALGVSLSLLAVQHTSAAVASTLMATPPVLIIPAAVFVFQEKVTGKEVLGAVVAVIGVALLFI